MERKYIILGLIVCSLIVVALIFFQLSKPSFSNPGSSNLQCVKSLYNGDPSTKINIVILLKDIEKSKINETISYLLSNEPFSNYKDKFNFYTIDFFPECEYYQGIALLCYSRDLIKKTAVCPNDFIFVIAKDSVNIRSSAYMNVLSINSNLPDSVFLHEFGHAFANLADEYIPAKIPWGSKNCQINCDNFKGIGGCFQGCSDNGHLRSSENSVMKTLRTSNYEDFNENIILEVLTKY